MNDRYLNLDDAQALLGRARNHLAAFEDQVSPRNLWRIAESQDSESKEWTGQIHLNRAGLGRAKPILADCANNLISALDHVAAAIARSNGHGRERSLYFPLGLTDTDHARAMSKVERMLGREVVRVLTETRARHQIEMPHVAAVKEISNTGKHWELLVSNASAHGVAWTEPGLRQRIAQIPADAFENRIVFEFYRGAQPLPRVPLNIVIKLTLAGLGSGLPTTPEYVLHGALRYVEAVIAAVAQAVP